MRCICVYCSSEVLPIHVKIAAAFPSVPNTGHGPRVGSGMTVEASHVYAVAASMLAVIFALGLYLRKEEK